MQRLIRPMQLTDLDSVYAIEAAAHLAPWGRDLIRDCILVGYDCRVLEIQVKNTEHIVAYLMCRYHERQCHVINLCVSPNDQRQGHGRYLLEDLIEGLKDSPVERIWLEVRQSNQGARDLYYKLGFKEVGVKQDYYRDEAGLEDAIELELLFS